MSEVNEFESIVPYTDEEAVEALGKLADHPAVLEISKSIFPDQKPVFLLNSCLDLFSAA